jgi:hypothetical protein
VGGFGCSGSNNSGVVSLRSLPHGVSRLLRTFVLRAAFA